MERTHLKIAVFHLGFFYSGGGEKLVLEEVRALRELGHEVDCYAPYVDRDKCFPDMPEIADVRPLLPPPPAWLPLKGVLWIALCCLLCPLMAWHFHTHEVLFGANQPGCWFALVLSRLLRKPYVIYLAHPLRILYPREIDQRTELRIQQGDQRFIACLTKAAGWLVEWADRMSVRHADAVLTNGEHVSAWIGQVYQRDNITCPAGCHPLAAGELEYAGRWQGQLHVNGMTVTKPYLLLSNRHVPQKRFEYAIWALRTIVREAPNLALVITGHETEYTDQLRRLVDVLGLTGKVHFVGLVTERDLAILYQQAVLYVYPSPQEDFGMGIVEAMAAGTPVVAWNNGGPSVTVKDGETGCLIEPDHTAEFAAQIRRLALNPQLIERMGRAAHRRAGELYSYERHRQILEKALVAAVQNFGRAGQTEEISMRAPTWVQE